MTSLLSAPPSDAAIFYALTLAGAVMSLVGGVIVAVLLIARWAQTVSDRITRRRLVRWLVGLGVLLVGCLVAQYYLTEPEGFAKRLFDAASLVLSWISGGLLVLGLLLLTFPDLLKRVGIEVPQETLMKAVPAAASLFLMGLIGQTIATRQKMDTLQAEVGKKIELLDSGLLQKMETLQADVGKQVEEIRRIIPVREALSLDDVVGRIETEIATKTKEPLKLWQIALDMADFINAFEPTGMPSSGWPSKLGSRPVEYYALIMKAPPFVERPLTEVLLKDEELQALLENNPGLSKEKPLREYLLRRGHPQDPEVIMGWPTETLRWSVMGEGILANEVWPRLQKLAELHKVGNKFTFRIRQYAEVPFVHGFRTQSEKSGRIYRTASCRWAQNETDWEPSAPKKKAHTPTPTPVPRFTSFMKWDWGKHSYFEVRSTDPNRATVERDSAAQFDARFAHLWEAAMEDYEIPEKPSTPTTPKPQP